MIEQITDYQEAGDKKEREAGCVAVVILSAIDPIIQEMGIAYCENLLISWSGGKDSAIALYEIRVMQNYQISALLTMVTEEYDRISVHGVWRSLFTLKEQQCALLDTSAAQAAIVIDKPNSSKACRSRMQYFDPHIVDFF